MKPIEEVKDDYVTLIIFIAVYGGHRGEVRTHWRLKHTVILKWYSEEARRQEHTLLFKRAHREGMQTEAFCNNEGGTKRRSEAWGTQANQGAQKGEEACGLESILLLKGTWKTGEEAQGTRVQMGAWRGEEAQALLYIISA